MEIRPKDFIETKEGLIFSAISKKAAFLRYFPMDNGDRQKKGISYRKVGSTLDSFNYLEKKFPAYILKKKGYRIQFCPKERISRIYLPEERLKKIYSTGNGFLKKCLSLSEILSTVPLRYKGVTGSILVGLETPSSDIDFIVYGEKNFEKARNVIRNCDEIEEFEKDDWKKYYKKRFPSIAPLDFQDFLWHEKRKHNIGKVEGVHFNLLLGSPSIDLKPSFPLKRTIIRCKVLDSEQAYSMPAIYAVEHKLVDRVVCFTHSYAGQALKGEVIEVSGVLEKTAEKRLQMVVGTSREAHGEFIRVVTQE